MSAIKYLVPISSMMLFAGCAKEKPPVPEAVAPVREPVEKPASAPKPAPAAAAAKPEPTIDWRKFVVAPPKAKEEPRKKFVPSSPISNGTLTPVNKEEARTYLMATLEYFKGYSRLENLDPNSSTNEVKLAMFKTVVDMKFALGGKKVPPALQEVDRNLRAATKALEDGSGLDATGSEALNGLQVASAYIDKANKELDLFNKRVNMTSSP